MHPGLGILSPPRLSRPSVFPRCSPGSPTRLRPQTPRSGRSTLYFRDFPALAGPQYRPDRISLGTQMPQSCSVQDSEPEAANGMTPGGGRTRRGRTQGSPDPGSRMGR